MLLEYVDTEKTELKEKKKKNIWVRIEKSSRGLENREIIVA